MNANIRNRLMAALIAFPMAAQASSLADAEVRKIDKDAGKVTLKHGEIKNLEMPPMTMVFKVKDKAMLDAVKVGDKIKIAAEKIDGSYTVTKIEMPATK
jgi:Cu(I)/Ag(I) efflux system periplasmic protein CusF